MRPTLHDYNLQKLSDMDCTAISDVLNFTNLTNRAPRLGDFVPCDEDENVLEKPDIHSLDHSTAVAMHNEYQAAQDRVIFKGDWEVVNLLGGTFDLISKDYNVKLRMDEIKSCPLVINDERYPYKVNRIEDLPLQIEFKEGVI